MGHLLFAEDHLPAASSSVAHPAQSGHDNDLRAHAPLYKDSPLMKLAHTLKEIERVFHYARKNREQIERPIGPRLAKQVVDPSSYSRQAPSQHRQDAAQFGGDTRRACGREGFTASSVSPASCKFGAASGAVEAASCSLQGGCKAIKAEAWATPRSPISTLS